MIIRFVVFLGLVAAAPIAAQIQRAKLDSVFAAEQGTDGPDAPSASCRTVA